MIWRELFKRQKAFDRLVVLFLRLLALLNILLNQISQCSMLYEAESWLHKVSFPANTAECASYNQTSANTLQSG